MVRYYRTHYYKTKTCACLFGGKIGFKQFHLIFRRDTESVITDIHPDTIIFLIIMGANFNSSVMVHR